MHASSLKMVLALVKRPARNILPRLRTRHACRTRDGKRTREQKINVKRITCWHGPRAKLGTGGGRARHESARVTRGVEVDDCRWLKCGRGRLRGQRTLSLRCGGRRLRGNLGGRLHDGAHAARPRYLDAVASGDLRYRHAPWTRGLICGLARLFR